MARNSNNKTLEDVTIAFRNFAGKEDVYNREGDRNFAILLDEDRAAEMERDGWNVKYLKARDEDEVRQPYIQVAVSFKKKPPKIVLVTSKNMSYLGEDLVEQLDWVDIETADVTLYPYEWAVGEKHGVKAYLQTLFMKIEEDYLEEKWKSIMAETKQIAAAEDRMVIEGEYEVH